LGTILRLFVAGRLRRIRLWLFTRSVLLAVSRSDRVIQGGGESRLLKYFRYPWAVFGYDRVRLPAVRLPDLEGCGRIFLADRVIEFLFACVC
jgi:hypothetical protein